MTVVPTEQLSRYALFQDGIKKTLASVHVRHSLAKEALEYLDSQLLQVSVRLAGFDCTTKVDMNTSIAALMPAELYEYANKAGEEAVGPRKPSKHDYKRMLLSTDLLFPLDNVSESFKPQADPDFVPYVVAVVEYLCADILKAAGNHSENAGRFVIEISDIKAAIALDTTLNEFFMTIWSGQLLLWLKEREIEFGRDLHILIKVFGEVLEPLEDANALRPLFKKVNEMYGFHKNALKIIKEAKTAEGIRKLIELLLSERPLFDSYLSLFNRYALPDMLKAWRSKLSVLKLLEDTDLLRPAETHLEMLLLQPLAHVVGYVTVLMRMRDLDRSFKPLADRAVNQIAATRNTINARNMGPISGDANPGVAVWRRYEQADLQKRIEGWNDKSLPDWNARHFKDFNIVVFTGTTGSRKNKKSHDRTLLIFDKFIIFTKLKTDSMLLSKKAQGHVFKSLLLVSDMVVKLPADDSIKYSIEVTFKNSDTVHVLACRDSAQKRELLALLQFIVSGHSLSVRLEQVLAQSPTLVLPPVSMYRFAEPDSLENIVLDVSSERTVIKGGTLLKLIERLTHPEVLDDTNYTDQFLCTYQSFMEPMQLLDLLLERFNVPNPPNATAVQLEEFTEIMKKPMQLRVINVLRKWSGEHLNDFIKDKKLCDKLEEFANSLPKEKDKDGPGSAILRNLKKRDKPIELKVFAAPPPKPILHGVVDDKVADFRQIDPLEFARQMTLLDFDIYRKIQPYECIRQRWCKTDRETEAPHITALSAGFNRMSNWVKTAVTFTEDIHARVDLVGYLIRVCERCFELNNFDGAMQIASGLNSVPVNRLRVTWSLLPRQTATSFAEILVQLNHDKSYSRLRQELHTRAPPCLPFVGVYLTDLTFIEEGNRDLLAGTQLINFAKHRRTAAVIAEVQRYQLQPYNFERVEAIAKFLSNLPSEDDETCYEKSLEIEPRGVTRDEVLGASQSAASGGAGNSGTIDYRRSSSFSIGANSANSSASNSAPPSRKGSKMSDGMSTSSKIANSIMKSVSKMTSTRLRRDRSSSSNALGMDQSDDSIAPTSGMRPRLFSFRTDDSDSGRATPAAPQSPDSETPSTDVDGKLRSHFETLPRSGSPDLRPHAEPPTGSPVSAQPADGSADAADSKRLSTASSNNAAADE